MNKKQLYESIMKDVSKIVKKHLNEAKISWVEEYKLNVLTWITNIVDDPEYVNNIEERLDVNTDAVDAGYALANAMIANMEAGGMDMIVPDDPDFNSWLIKTLATGYDAKANNGISEHLIDIMNTQWNELEEGFNDALINEAYYFLNAKSERDVKRYANSGDYYYVCILNSEGEWIEV